MSNTKWTVSYKDEDGEDTATFNNEKDADEWIKIQEGRRSYGDKFELINKTKITEEKDFMKLYDKNFGSDRPETVLGFKLAKYPPYRLKTLYGDELPSDFDDYLIIDDSEISKFKSINFKEVYNKDGFKLFVGPYKDNCIIIKFISKYPDEPAEITYAISPRYIENFGSDDNYGDTQNIDNIDREAVFQKGMSLAHEIYGDDAKESKVWKDVEIAIKQAIENGGGTEEAEKILEGMYTSANFSEESPVKKLYNL